MSPEQDIKDLYDLEMMEAKDIGDFEVTRVPGGWIFKSTTRHFSRGISFTGSESMIFVPYVEEG